MSDGRRAQVHGDKTQARYKLRNADPERRNKSTIGHSQSMRSFAEAVVDDPMTTGPSFTPKCGPKYGAVPLIRRFSSTETRETPPVVGLVPFRISRDSDSNDRPSLISSPSVLRIHLSNQQSVVINMQLEILRSRTTYCQERLKRTSCRQAPWDVAPGCMKAAAASILVPKRFPYLCFHPQLQTNSTLGGVG